MRKYPKTQINLLIRDRKNGLSILDLMRKYEMPKTSVWHHIRSIRLSAKKVSILRSRQGAGFRRRVEAEDMARKEAETLTRNINFNKAFLLVVSALYWAEGHKKAFTFTNTDPRMLKVFLKGMRKTFQVGRGEWSLLIRITKDNDADRVLHYWERVIGISQSNIKVNVDIAQNKSKAMNGICRLTLRKGGYRLKLMNAIIQIVVEKFA
ncbi:MAG: hypothetical protein AAB819_01990 [Patescibacteria group bacterium]